ncbi:MAG: methylenetetrahydrofolate reductase [NAD(P)H] [Steroidobacterales bacterium]
MPLSKRIAVSFEFFPPADDSGAAQLWESIQRLAPLRPRFVSVTYGADGSTRSRTHDCVRRIANETDLVVAPHLTCVTADRDEVLGLAATYWREGRRHIVALRGDAPATATALAGSPGGRTAGFAYAADLVRALRGIGDFDIAVAAYPEGHPESGSVAADVENLQRKIAAGASRAITQFFFDTDLFLRYRDRCVAAGIDVPIVPGILPITQFAQMRRFAARCGTSVPDWLQRRFDGLDHDPAGRLLVAADVAVEQVRSLHRHGVGEFHFYTLNRPELTYEVCRALGLHPAPPEPRFDEGFEPVPVALAQCLSG